MQPPDVANVAAADKETFSDLQARYKVGCNTCSLRLEKFPDYAREPGNARGDLNADTAAAVMRFQLLFGLAAGSMLDHRWDEVLNTFRLLKRRPPKL